MKLLLQLEELFMFIGSAVFLYVVNASWWWYLLLFIGPDISMLGYLSGKKTGALLYNIFHHKAVAAIVFLTGMWMENLNIMLVGLILFGHASMDRTFGYGLKFYKGFRFTHLGEIRSKKN